jgi:hypothetical protein
MGKIRTILVLIVGLTGCVSHNMSKGLSDLNGQNIQAAVAQLGPPAGQWQLLGSTVYVWKSGNSSGAPLPGQPGCTIQISTDPAGMIKSSQWAGDRGDCSTFANDLWASSVGLPSMH